MDFAGEMKRRQALLEAEWTRLTAPRHPEQLYAAMAYSLLSPGKRLRPMLALAACEACGGAESDALPFACALEMIHAYSLIHDDLPAMDDDCLRRGMPTNHIVYGEAMAILAGDALLNLAYETMAVFCEAHPERRFIRAVRLVAEAAGANGMVGGQAVDVLSENKRITEAELLYIHQNKTGKLICAALCAGAAAAGAADSVIGAFASLGEALGLAFQIKDDILDVAGDAAMLGKPVHSDERNRKNTFVSQHGMDAACEKHDALCADIRAAAERLAGQSTFLPLLLAQMAERLK